MNSIINTSIFLLIFLFSNDLLLAQLSNCDRTIVPDDLQNGKVVINLSDMCSACGPYGGGNGSLGNPPNGATGCGIIRFRRDNLLNCGNISLDPQASEKTDYYFDPMVSEADCFAPEETTSGQGETFQFNINTLEEESEFFDLLVCSQSTGNRSFFITIGCCPNPGTGRDTSICENDTNTIYLNSILIDADPGGSWSRISGQGGEFDMDNGTFKSSDGADTSVFVYTLPDNDANSECNLNSMVSINITPRPNAGNNNAVKVCSLDPPLDLFDLLTGTPSISGFWSGPEVLANGHLGTLDPKMHPGGLYQYVVPGVGACDNDTADVTVQVIDFPSAGTDGSIPFCENETKPKALILGLGGMPDEGGSWSPMTSVPGIFNPEVDSPGTYTYTVTGTQPCGHSSAVVVVSISDEPDPGQDNEITICIDAGSFNLLDSLNGHPDGGGIWSPPLGSGGNIFDPSIDEPGQYTYSFDIRDCNTGSSTITVDFEQVLSGGNNSMLSVCTAHDPVDLYSLIGDPGVSGTWSGPENLTNGYLGTFDPSLHRGGLYQYTINGNRPCADLILDVEVSVYATPHAGENKTIEMCQTDNPVDLTTMLGEDISLSGYWEPALYSGGHEYSPYLDGGGNFTYVIDATVGCPEQISVLTIKNYEPNQAGQSSIVKISRNDAPFNLFNKLGMSPDPGGRWNPAPKSGTGMFDPSIDEEGIYTYHTEPNVACEADLSHVEVQILNAESVPTMGTWGVIILLLLMSIISLISLRSINKIQKDTCY